MGRYILRRLIQTIPLMFVISFMLFAMVNLLGDPTAVFAESNRPVSGNRRLELIRRLGLDKPVHLQYVTWLIGNDWEDIDVRGDGTLMQKGTRRGILRGDFGRSFAGGNRPVIDRINERLPNTLVLMLTSYGLVVFLSIIIGVYSAMRPYSFIDNMITGLCFFFFSMPIFFLAIMMIFIFGVLFYNWNLPTLPIHGTGDGTLGSLVQHMILPVFCLVAIQVAGYIRFIRSSVMEVMEQDYIRTAHAKGLSRRKVLLSHAFKNAALPLVTLIGLDLPALLAGAVVTENSFNWPGMGQLFIQSLQGADFNVMMAILILLTVAVIMFQLLTDLTYTWLDPRIRYA
jgi:peptide/nickel transport system permease protein